MFFLKFTPHQRKDASSNFHILFKAYRDKIMIRQQSIVKNFDQFSDSKEQEVKERAEKRCAERRQKAEDLKAKKRKQNI